MTIGISATNITLDIPIYDGSQMRLFRKPAMGRTVGGNFSSLGRVPTVRALDCISFSVKEGDRIGLIGHNGAGKTTLLKLLSRVYYPDQGELKIEGVVGALLEIGSGLIQDLTGYECITLLCKYKKLKGATVERLIKDIEEFTELGEYLSLPIRVYSAGMRSRLASAMATGVQYDILLIDEGISAGDAAFQEKFQNRINRYLEKAPILIMASHSNDLLRQYCTYGIVLSRGKLAFQGPVDDALDYYANHH